MEFQLPEIGEGVVEAELIHWLVQAGDTVKAGQPLIEVMTDKANVEIPSPGDGVISGLAARGGDLIKVGQTLASIGGGASASAGRSAEMTPEKTTEKTKKPSGGEGADNGPRPPEPDQPAEEAAAWPAEPNASAASPPAGASPGGAALPPSHVPATPLVRALAWKAGVDLGSVPGSGPKVGDRNRVLERDLLRFLNARVAPASSGPSATPVSSDRSSAQAGVPPTHKTILPLPATDARPELPGATETVERSPLRGLRRVIAQAMVRSKFTAPHYSYVDKFECSALVELRAQAKVLGGQHGVKVSYLPFIVKALVGALQEFPLANSSLEEKDGQFELVQKKFYHIGIAVASSDGLVVPVIRHADRKSLLEIAREIDELSAKVRAGQAAPDELKGSTFTLTSMGNVGGLFATPIINYPEVGILGVHKIQEEALVKDGQIYVGKTMHLSLSFDHRVVDGAVGGSFCNAIIARLQNPARFLTERVL